MGTIEAVQLTENRIGGEVVCGTGRGSVAYPPKRRSCGELARASAWVGAYGQLLYYKRAAERAACVTSVPRAFLAAAWTLVTASGRSLATATIGGRLTSIRPRVAPCSCAVFVREARQGRERAPPGRRFPSTVHYLPKPGSALRR